MIKIGGISSLISGSLSVTLGKRLFAFLIALVVMMILGVFIVLLATGSISADIRAPQIFAEKEFARLHQSITDNCGDTVIKLVYLSQTLSRSIEFQLSNRNIAVDRLKNHPEVLEEIIGDELNRLRLILERTACSGVFMILDATVNPALANAEHSKAGLYIRKFEPNVQGDPEVQYLYYRGFPGIAYQNNLLMRTAWDMEFNVEGSDFYHLPIEKSKADMTNQTPLRELYYWSMENVIPELTESALMCSIPLIDSNGNPFGVCGFEISAWNFAVNYMPDNSNYKDILCLFSTIEGNKINADNALVSGSPLTIGKLRGRESLFVTGRSGLNLYDPENSSPFLGLHKDVKMYSAFSPFAGRSFAVSLLISKEEIDAARKTVNARLIFICAALLILGIGVSIFISKRYLKPITSALDSVKTGHPEIADKTKIAEIDTLLDYIGKLIEERKIIEEEKASIIAANEQRKKEDAVKSDASAESFAGSAVQLQKAALFDKLTFQELRVAEMTLRGYTYSEVADELNLANNTVKWYQKILYSKLGINSKRELFELARKRA